MATQQSGEFNVEEQLRLLRQSRTHLCRILTPEAILPELSVITDVELERRILDMADAGKREEAMGLVIDRVLDRGEAGLNHFLVAVGEEGDNAGWPQALALLGHASSIDDANRSPSNYYAFIIHLLKGKIIEKLTDGILSALIVHLSSKDVIEEYEKDLIEAKLKTKGCRYAALQLFSVLGMHREDWPVFFFEALRKEVPSLLEKMCLFGIDPVISKEESEFNVGRGVSSDRMSPEVTRSEDQEQTLPKQLATLQNAQAPGGCQADGGANLSDEEKESERSSSDRVPSSGAVSMTETADSDDVDDGRSGFSDDEKQDVEVSEKTTEGREGVPRARNQDLELRRYQFELAEKAVQGHNTIICAPTGSGKTRVALHIVKQHLTAAPQGQTRKVVFLARTVPLVSQQYRNFRDYLPEYNCELVTGESGNSMTVHQILDKNDILVLTPKILENHLRPDKIPSLSVFSLIIFDECHHTRKGEPYNSVMLKYLESKKNGEKNLPQIVGLTASIGVEKASTVEKAMESIINIMGNLDVKKITKVEEHLKEMEETVPRPDEHLGVLTPREGDEVSSAIEDNMKKIESLLEGQFPVPQVDSDIDRVRPFLGKRPGDRKSQKYGQWAVQIRMETSKVHIPEHPDRDHPQESIERRRLFTQNVQLLAETLVFYNDALDVHELTRPVDVLDYLKSKLDPRHPASAPKRTQLENQLVSLFEGLQKKLKKPSPTNPNLRILSEEIRKKLHKKWDTSRVMVFVRTRATCAALCNWLNSPEVEPELRGLNASPFTGSGATQELGGMTQPDQESVVDKFRAGEVKLLVCTSVGQEGMDIPDCNLVIRYNHVGNEVTTVQVRGRCRKAGGVSMLIAMPPVIRKERINKKRVEIMNEAIDRVTDMRKNEVSNQVKKAQNKAMDKEKQKRAGQKSKTSTKRQGSFYLACGLCRKVRVAGSRIRTIEKCHHVIIGNDLVDNKEVSIRPLSKSRTVDNVQFTGEITCNKCPSSRQKFLGTTLKYQEVRYLTIKAESWVVLDDNNMLVKSGKWKWKDIDALYEISELTSADVNLHLGQKPEDEEDEMPEDEGEEQGAVGGMAN